MSKTNETAAKNADTKGTDAKGVSLEKSPEGAAQTAANNAATDGKPAAADETPVDPFANLPVITVGEDDGVTDLSSMEASPAYKYDKVAADAAADKLPLMRGWKHAEAVFVPGTNRGGENGFKPGSVWGTIMEIVRRAGKQGISAQELVTAVRVKQIGNKRSKYCTALPPVGWAEGWIASAYTRNIVGIHPTKKAKPLTVAARDSEATAEQNDAATKAAAAA